MNGLNILLTTKLSDKKLKDKLTPIINSQYVSSIEVVRAVPGLPLKKVKYFPLPKLTRKNLFLEILCLFVYLPIRLAISRPDVLIGIYYVPYGFFVQLLGKTFRIPVVSSLIGSDITLYRDKPLLWKIMRKIMVRCNLHTITGNQTKKLLISEGFDPSKIIVLPNPIDPTKYFPQKQDKEYDLISVSNLTRGKRIDLILKALVIIKEEYPKIRFAIAGDGPEREKIELLTKKLKLQENIKFLGKRKDIPDLLHKSKIYILTSSNEGLSVSMMEAMASGLPVICTEVGDVTDVISNYNNGILIPPNNPQAVVTALLFLLKSPKKAHEIGMNALSILQTNSPQAATKRWNEIFKHLKLDL